MLHQPACLDAGVPLRAVQIAARMPTKRTTARYDRMRRPATAMRNYVVTAFIAGAS